MPGCGKALPGSSGAAGAGSRFTALVPGVTVAARDQELRGAASQLHRERGDLGVCLATASAQLKLQLFRTDLARCRVAGKCWENAQTHARLRWVFFALEIFNPIPARILLVLLQQ